MYPFICDLSFLSLVLLLDVACGADIRLFGTRGGKVDGSEGSEEVGNHEALLFSAAKPAAAHDILLDADTVASGVVFVSAAAALGDHVILLGLGFDADDGDDSDDERDNFS